MTDEEKALERIIYTVGKSTMKKYEDEFIMIREGDMTKDELARLFSSNENWSDGSITTKINAGLRVVAYDESEYHPLMKEKR